MAGAGWWRRRAPLSGQTSSTAHGAWSTTKRAGGARGADLVIVDTAGRLHTKVNLMDELTKVRRIVDKRLPGAEPETLFVLDATTGQNGLAQAKAFHEAVGLTGIVLTKLDSTSKGGIVFAIEGALKIPVRFVGVGEGVNDLLPFDPDAFVEALFAEESAAPAADRLIALHSTTTWAGVDRPSAAGRAMCAPVTSTGSRQPGARRSGPGRPSPASRSPLRAVPPRSRR